ncbi:hypothetical protein V2J09_000443 [Rumex salicifolius]
MDDLMFTSDDEVMLEEFKSSMKEEFDMTDLGPYHFLRELSKERIVELVYCSTEEQLADIMTKALKLESFMKLQAALGMSTGELNSVES